MCYAEIGLFNQIHRQIQFMRFMLFLHLFLFFHLLDKCMVNLWHVLYFRESQITDSVREHREGNTHTHTLKNHQIWLTILSIIFRIREIHALSKSEFYWFWKLLAQKCNFRSNIITTVGFYHLIGKFIRFYCQN